MSLRKAGLVLLDLLTPVLCTTSPATPRLAGARTVEPQTPKIGCR